MLARFFQKYTGFLRNLKASYVINNLLHVGDLRPNRVYYRRFGLRKNVWSPIGSKDFGGQHDPDIPWLDQPGAMERLEQHPRFQSLNAEMQSKIRQFVTDGYLVLENYFPESDTAALNAEVAQLLDSGKTGFNYTGRKIFNLPAQSEIADSFYRNAQLLEYLSFLLGKPALPFQSMNFTLGSEQRAHSDSIHMMTEPPGYLIATWIALEDCSEGNGPLFYYPGSHRLPFITTEHYKSGNTFFTIGENSNRRYEDKIAEIVAENGLKKQLFLAKRGDVLIWHANLLHGGSPITRPGATRKSMVCHYFAEGVFCYHEMSQRPALIKRS
ncbi:MAG: phytanoyl-CoA dioxygenase family protein [Saprospiraceae bacterium]|nr:phytanoyl-CoA dioxygenase family protein [Saprospiraceae bacterium]